MTEVSCVDGAQVKGLASYHHRGKVRHCGAQLNDRCRKLLQKGNTPMREADCGLNVKLPDSSKLGETLLVRLLDVGLPKGQQPLANRPIRVESRTTSKYH
eukprot:1524751-Amphidinium_carterae.2